MSDYALIAEPDPGRSRMYQNLVLQHGLEPVSRRDGNAAHQILQSRGAPALLLTDLSLSLSDGFSLLRELRKTASSQVTPAVVLSAFSGLRLTAWQMRGELGIQELLSKMAPLSAVDRALKRALSGGRKGDIPRPGSSRPLRQWDEKRLHQVLIKGILDEEGALPDPGLQALVAEVAGIFNVPCAMISIILNDRHWLKAQVGLRGLASRKRLVPMDLSLCRHVVNADRLEPLVVPDLRGSPVFGSNEFMAQQGIGSYAGAPLISPEGAVLGVLSIADTKPLEISPEGVDLLVKLARRVAGELEVRCDAKKSVKRASELQQTLHQEKAKGAALSSTLNYAQAVLGSMVDGVLLMDQNRNILLANQTLAEMFDLPVDEILKLSGDAFMERAAQFFDDPADYLQKIRVLGEGPFAAQAEFEMQRPHRKIVKWISKPIALADQQGQIAFFNDITSEVEFALERERIALTDPLTGVTNRRGGEEALARETARSIRAGSPLCVGLFDIDFFKRINDVLGHLEGDRVLKQFAQILSESIRTADIAIRWGGEEFLILFSGISLQGAKEAAERIREATQRILLPAIGFLTVSAGIAEYTPGEEIEQWIARADTKLYEAKTSGRNCVRCAMNLAA